MLRKNNDTEAIATIRADYQRRVDALEIQLNQIEERFVWVIRLRGATFFGAIGCLLLAWVSTGPATPWLTAAGAVFVLFVGLCGYHEHLERNKAVVTQRQKISRTQIERMNRNWQAIWNPEVEVPVEHQAVANDLDLFGKASLFQLIGNAFSPMGIETLQSWLLSPAPPDTIIRRQNAVQRLAPLADWREEFNLRGRVLAASPSGPEKFVEWAEDHCWLSLRPFLKWTVRLLAAAIPCFILAASLGVLQIEYAYAASVVVILINILISVFLTGQVHDIFDTVSSRSNDIQHYRGTFELIGQLPDDDPLIKKEKAKLGSPPSESLELLRRLSRIIRCANLRRSPTTAIVHVLVQIVFLLDFHILSWLESWQRRYGKKVRAWFEAIGELEAISSLATLSYDNPHWAWPSITSDSSVPLQADSIGHPLLPEDVAVRNDAQVGPPGRFMLVTGSNMSGKSTMLRSIGLNAILAQAGAPVCATAMSLPPVEVATSMRIQDSLDDGVSFFMAELKRLKEIVDLSTEVNRGNRRLLFLLDEILQGTNSVERHLAVARVIERLVGNGSFGAVSTHDLELAKSPELVGTCEIVHFRENIEGEGSTEKMTFDYKMRPGLATTTNALKLLKLVGLVD